MSTLFTNLKLLVKLRHLEFSQYKEDTLAKVKRIVEDYKDKLSNQFSYLKEILENQFLINLKVDLRVGR